MSIQKWTVMREQVGASYVIMDLYETEKKKKRFQSYNFRAGPKPTS